MHKHTGKTVLYLSKINTYNTKYNKTISWPLNNIKNQFSLIVTTSRDTYSNKNYINKIIKTLLGLYDAKPITVVNKTPVWRL